MPLSPDKARTVVGGEGTGTEERTKGQDAWRNAMQQKISSAVAAKSH